MKPCPICAECAQEMRVSKNDFPVISPKATINYGDLWECESCGHEIVMSFGEGRPSSECSPATIDDALPYVRQGYLRRLLGQ